MRAAVPSRGSPGSVETPESRASLLYRVVRLLARVRPASASSGSGSTTAGQEHLPRAATCSSAAAHRGWMDPFLVLARAAARSRGSGSSAARPSTFTSRWREALVHRLGGLLPVWRGGVGVEQHVASARAVIANGGVFAQMPEGTVSGPAGRIGPFRVGLGADRAADRRADRPVRDRRAPRSSTSAGGWRRGSCRRRRSRELLGPAWDGMLPAEGSREELDLARRLSERSRRVLGPGRRGALSGDRRSAGPSAPAAPPRWLLLRPGRLDRTDSGAAGRLDPPMEDAVTSARRARLRTVAIAGRVAACRLRPACATWLGVLATVFQRARRSAARARDLLFAFGRVVDVGRGRSSTPTSGRRRGGGRRRLRRAGAVGRARARRRASAIASAGADRSSRPYAAAGMLMAATAIALAWPADVAVYVLATLTATRSRSRPIHASLAAGGRPNADELTAANVASGHGPRASDRSLGAARRRAPRRARRARQRSSPSRAPVIAIGAMPASSASATVADASRRRATRCRRAAATPVPRRRSRGGLADDPLDGLSAALAALRGPRLRRSSLIAVVGDFLVGALDVLYAVARDRPARRWATRGRASRARRGRRRRSSARRPRPSLVGRRAARPAPLALGLARLGRAGRDRSASCPVSSRRGASSSSPASGGAELDVAGRTLLQRLRRTTS